MNDARRDFLERVDLLMLMGKLLHQYGAAAHRIEGVLTSLSEGFGIHGQFFAMPTSLNASFRQRGEEFFEDEELSRLIRVKPGGINLGKLHRIYEVTEEMLNGQMQVSEASKRLRAVRAEEPSFPWWMTPLVYTSASAAISLFFNPRLSNLLASALAGFLIGLIFLLSRKKKEFSNLIEAVAGFVAVCTAAGMSLVFDDLSVATVVISGLIILLPGLTLTTAVSELATENWGAGTARLMGAVVSLLKMVFGVFFAVKLIEFLFGVQTYATVYVESPQALSVWGTGLALLAAALSFAVLFQSLVKDIPLIVAAVFVGYASSRGVTLSLGPEIGSFVGGLVVCAGSNLLMRYIGRPSHITLVPGILIMVPGSIAYRSLTMLQGEDYFGGIQFAVKATLILISIVAGLLLGGSIVTPRRGF